MKKSYAKPEIEIVEFDSADIITASGGVIGGGEVTPDPGDWD